MSAKRYSGNATISIALDDAGSIGNRQNYRVTITQGGKRGKAMNISAPIRGGSGVGVDSPKMFDEVAQSALAFAANDKTIDDDDLDIDEAGWIKVYRSKQAWHGMRGAAR